MTESRMTTNGIRAGIDGITTPKITSITTDPIRFDGAMSFVGCDGTIDYSNNTLNLWHLGVESNSLYPTVSSFSLGASSHRWSSFYATNCNLNGNLVLEDSFTCLPYTTNTIDLGSSSKRFRYVYSNNLVIGSNDVTSALSYLHDVTNATTLGQKLTAGTGITITNGVIATNIVIGNGNTSIAGTANQVLINDVSGTSVISLPQSIATSSTPTFAGLILGSTNVTAAATYLSDAITSPTLTSKIAIGKGLLYNAGAIENIGVLELVGTGNQVNLNASTGTVTLSLPQSIATTSTPTFAGLVLGANDVTESINYLRTVVSPTTLAAKLIAGTGISISAGTISLDSLSSPILAGLSIGVHNVTAAMTYVRDVTSNATLAAKISPILGSGLAVSSNVINNTGVLGLVGANGLVVSSPVNGVITLTAPSGVSAGVSSITGTNGITASATTGDVTLSFNSSYTPTFAGVNLGSSNASLTYSSTLGTVNLVPSSNSAQDLSLNPSAYNSVILYENFKSGTPRQGGVLQGSKSGSAWSPSIITNATPTYVRLTDGSTSTFGQLVYKGHPGNAFTAEFDVRIASLAAADGVWFFFNHSSVPTNITYGGGTNGGYEIAINQYNNNGAGSVEDGITVGTGDQIMIHFNGTLLISSPSNLVEGDFTRIKVIFAVNQFWITANEIPVPGMYPFTDSVIRSLSQTNNYMGVAAWCGGTPTTQDVANFRIAKSNGGPITPTTSSYSCGATLFGASTLNIPGTNPDHWNVIGGKLWVSYDLANSAVYNGCTITQSNTAIQVPVSGLYVIHCGATMGETQGDRYAYIYVKKNGNAIERSKSHMRMTGQYLYVSSTIVERANANDYFQFFLYMDVNNTFSVRSLQLTVHSI